MLLYSSFHIKATHQPSAVQPKQPHGFTPSKFHILADRTRPMQIVVLHGVHLGRCKTNVQGALVGVQRGILNWQHPEDTLKSSGTGRDETMERQSTVLVKHCERCQFAFPTSCRVQWAHSNAQVPLLSKISLLGDHGPHHTLTMQAFQYDLWAQDLNACSFAWQYWLVRCRRTHGVTHQAFWSVSLWWECHQPVTQPFDQLATSRNRHFLERSRRVVDRTALSGRR